MKKTLIALAALAVAGAASAQVTLSGGVAYGYQATETAAGVKDSGFGMDTAAITLTATEDLGGGLKATGKISAGGLARGTAVTGEDMSMTLAGGFGTLMVGQIEIGSGIRGLAQAGAPVNNMEEEVLGAAVNSDIVKYTAPKMGDFTFSGSLTEAVGLGMGMENTSRAVTVGVDYAAGALKAKLDVSSWTDSTNDSRYRVAAQYNLGVATVGAGFDSTKLVAGTRVKYTMLGVSAPVGAFTVGAAYVKKDTATAGTQTGTTIGLAYPLSKRTSVTADYSSYEPVETPTAKAKKTTILLAHSF